MYTLNILINQNKLSQINNILSVLIIALPIYLIIVPYIPQIKYALIKKTANPAPYGSLEGVTTSHVQPQSKPLPKENRLVIPSALIDEPIKEGGSLTSVATGGIWHKTLNTTTPKEVGNTVLLGHRFTYQQPQGALYHLDKVSIGDVLAIYWNNEELLYKIAEKKVVSATAIDIENNTTDRSLTIYTCTPLLTAKDRLVVIAKPMEEK